MCVIVQTESKQFHKSTSPNRRSVTGPRRTNVPCRKATISRS